MPYNGFSDQRMQEARRWYKAVRKAGGGHNHFVCIACLRRGGTVDGHTEDYSKPFGERIGEHALCFPCHTAVHLRFRFPDAWDRYRRNIRNGIRYSDTTDKRSFEILFHSGGYAPPAENPPRKITWLDRLPMTEPAPVKDEDEQSLF